MTDTPIYDQLRLELSSQREPQDAAPRPRARAAEKPRAAERAPETSDTRQPVSVWTLVNANRRNKS
ncbi:hypothetical protein [Actinocrispum wychmicini]|uniref:hypothetical protein n=1 Tax=Actinocrispum wychmicini TaxID=1213861 RepID=UPI00104D06CB|nr:hypothetical protein [Actinocrispum wychmicini]